jgi:hypothetical protein
MAAIKAICSQMPDLRPWANLMSISRLDPDEEAVPESPEPERTGMEAPSSNGPQRQQPAGEKVAE